MSHLNGKGADRNGAQAHSRNNYHNQDRALEQQMKVRTLESHRLQALAKRLRAEGAHFFCPNCQTAANLFRLQGRAASLLPREAPHTHWACLLCGTGGNAAILQRLLNESDWGLAS